MSVSKNSDHRVCIQRWEYLYGMMKVSVYSEESVFKFWGQSLYTKMNVSLHSYDRVYEIWWSSLYTKMRVSVLNNEVSVYLGESVYKLLWQSLYTKKRVFFFFFFYYCIVRWGCLYTHAKVSINSDDSLYIKIRVSLQYGEGVYILRWEWL